MTKAKTNIEQRGVVSYTVGDVYDSETGVFTIEGNALHGQEAAIRFCKNVMGMSSKEAIGWVKILINCAVKAS